jgi:amino acid transporter
MSQVAPAVSTTPQAEDAQLERLGYQPQLNRVLGFFANFAVAFTYLSPMVGIYSLFLFGVASGGPAYVWLTWIPVLGMLFVALVFGELASHYPLAGALYQYSKYSAGPSYGWFVGWFYGIALLITVASVDTGVVAYFTAFTHDRLGWGLDPTNHLTILLITVALLAIQTGLNVTGAKVMGRVAELGVYVEILGTLGIAIILAIHGFNHGLDFLFTTQGVEFAKSNPAGLDFGGNWITGAALIAVLAPVYIFYGFESAGDISEETKDAANRVPRSMRLALIWGGVASFILTAALLLAMPVNDPVGATVKGGGVPFILGQLPVGIQDLLLVLIMLAFFSCGSSVQGAGGRLAFSYARDGALPFSAWLSRVNQRFKTPANALITGAVVTVLFVLLVYPSPDKDIKFLFITYPANTSALFSLVSFAVSGIYLSFLLTVIAAIIARRRGWVPAGPFRLGRWAWPVTIIAAVYLGLMLLDIIAPTGSPRSYFNLDWITLLVVLVVAVVGAIYFVAARPDKGVKEHLVDKAG